MRQVRTLWLLAVVWTVVTHFSLLSTANHRTVKTDNTDVTMSTKRASSPKSEASATVTASQKITTATTGPTVNTTNISTTGSPTTDRMSSTSSSGVTQEVTTSSPAVKEKNASKVTSSATPSQIVPLNESLAGAKFSSSLPQTTTAKTTPASVFFATTPTTTTTSTTTTTATTATTKSSSSITTSTIPLITTATTTTTTTTTTRNISLSTRSTASPSSFLTTTNYSLPISSATAEAKRISTTGQAPTDYILPKDTTSIEPSFTALKNRTSGGHAIRSIDIINVTTEDYETHKLQDKDDKFDLMLFPLNKTVPSTHGIPYENINTNKTKPKLNAHPQNSSGQLNISLPDDGEIVLSQTGMWTTPGKLAATKVIRLGYLTGSQIRESNESNEFYSSGFYRRPGQVISGALTLAVVEINNNPLVLPEHRVEFLPQETYGEETESILRTTQFLDKNISAYIGPQETCMHEARLAAVFNIPMISYVSTLFFFFFFTFSLSVSHLFLGYRFIFQASF